MKKFCFSSWALVLIVCVYASGCGFVSGQLRDKAMEKQLLKPGTLDAPVSTNYRTYSYKFLDRYRVTHDWISASQCRYAKNYFKGENPNPDLAEGAVLPVTENDGHTWQRGGIFDHAPPINVDRYVRAEWQSKDGYGNVRTNKGFSPICAQGWLGTSHSLSVNLVKLNLSDAIKRYTEPSVPVQNEKVGSNAWATQRAPLIPRESNTIGGSFLSWLLPVGDTGYTFVLELGANQDSLKHLEAHARMQEIFRHLIESVKIELLPEAERLNLDAEKPEREARLRAGLAAEEKRQSEYLEKQTKRKQKLKEDCKKIWNWNDFECKLLK